MVFLICKYKYKEWYTCFKSWKFGVILVALALKCNQNVMTKDKT